MKSFTAYDWTDPHNPTIREDTTMKKVFERGVVIRLIGTGGMLHSKRLEADNQTDLGPAVREFLKDQVVCVGDTITVEEIV